jgi:digeranylgeranylglycerophospholipid reductase
MSNGSIDPRGSVMKLSYDVVVVGGRVGGSTASLFASKSDVDVLMIEKRQEIGTPVQCAEGVTYGTFETLDIKPDEKYIRSRIKGAHIHAPDGRCISYEGELAEGMVLDRKIFDKELANNCQGPDHRKSQGMWSGCKTLGKNH